MELKMDGWIKYFTDGTKEIGSDDRVAQGLASWSKGRLHNIMKVALVDKNRAIEIIGSGEFWQEDIYESIFSCARSTRIARRIMKKLTSNDRGFTPMYQNSNRLIVLVNSCKNGFIPIESRETGMWLVAEIGNKQPYISYSIVNRDVY